MNYIFIIEAIAIFLSMFTLFYACYTLANEECIDQIMLSIFRRRIRNRIRNRQILPYQLAELRRINFHVTQILQENSRQTAIQPVREPPPLVEHLPNTVVFLNPNNRLQIGTYE